MIMTPCLRKLVLTAHIASSVGLLGAVAGFLALAIAGLTSPEAQTVRAAYVAMELIAWFVIVPLIFASLLVGVVQSLGTQWGLFRHYWILAKLVLTILATVVLLMQMGTIRYVAGVAAETTLSSADLFEARLSLIAHAGGGLLVLLVPVALSAYKPAGRTRYGRRLGPAAPDPSVANPKFASRWSGAPSEFRIQGHTSKLLNSSVVLDLKFLNADATKIAGTSNPPH